MRRRQTLPRLWLITDPRGGDPVAALGRMPRGSGVVVRHFELAEDARASLFELVRTKIRKHQGIALLAEVSRPGGAWVARGEGLLAHVVHNRRELVAAWRAGADLVFVSPVFATRSHPGVRALGVVRLGLLLRDNRLPAYPLGGMSKRRFRRLRGLPVVGWAGIDGFSVTPAKAGA